MITPFHEKKRAFIIRQPVPRVSLTLSVRFLCRANRVRVAMKMNERTNERTRRVVRFDRANDLSKTNRTQF